MKTPFCKLGLKWKNFKLHELDLQRKTSVYQLALIFIVHGVNAHFVPVIYLITQENLEEGRWKI